MRMSDPIWFPHHGVIYTASRCYNFVSIATIFNVQIQYCTIDDTNQRRFVDKCSERNKNKKKHLPSCVLIRNIHPRR